jgi:hypothetical protein
MWTTDVYEHACLLVLFFDDEDGGDMVFRNVDWLSTDCMGLYPRRLMSSLTSFRNLNFKFLRPHYF